MESAENQSKKAAKKLAKDSAKAAKVKFRFLEINRIIIFLILF